MPQIESTRDRNCVFPLFDLGRSHLYLFSLSSLLYFLQNPGLMHAA